LIPGSTRGFDYVPILGDGGEYVFVRRQCDERHGCLNALNSGKRSDCAEGECVTGGFRWESKSRAILPINISDEASQMRCGGTAWGARSGGVSALEKRSRESIQANGKSCDTGGSAYGGDAFEAAADVSSPGLREG